MCSLNFRIMDIIHVKSHWAQRKGNKTIFVPSRLRSEANHSKSPRYENNSKDEN